MTLQTVFLAEVSRQLRIARETAGVTQKQFASRLKSSQSTVAKMEAGARRIDIFEFTEMCAVLGISGEEILLAARRAIVDEVCGYRPNTGDTPNRNIRF